MMLKYSFGRDDAAQAIEQAVADTLGSGILTADIAEDKAGAVGTSALGDAVVRRILEG